MHTHTHSHTRARTRTHAHTHTHTNSPIEWPLHAHMHTYFILVLTNVLWMYYSIYMIGQSEMNYYKISHMCTHACIWHLLHISNNVECICAAGKEGIFYFTVSSGNTHVNYEQKCLDWYSLQMDNLDDIMLSWEQTEMCPCDIRQVRTDRRWRFDQSNREGNGVRHFCFYERMPLAVSTQVRRLYRRSTCGVDGLKWCYTVVSCLYCVRWVCMICWCTSSWAYLYVNYHQKKGGYV